MSKGNPWNHLVFLPQISRARVGYHCEGHGGCRSASSTKQLPDTGKPYSTERENIGEPGWFLVFSLIGHVARRSTYSRLRPRYHSKDIQSSPLTTPSCAQPDLRQLHRVSKLPWLNRYRYVRPLRDPNQTKHRNTWNIIKHLPPSIYQR